MLGVVSPCCFTVEIWSGCHLGGRVRHCRFQCHYVHRVSVFKVVEGGGGAFELKTSVNDGHHLLGCRQQTAYKMCCLLAQYGSDLETNTQTVFCVCGDVISPAVLYVNVVWCCVLCQMWCNMHFFV